MLFKALQIVNNYQLKKYLACMLMYKHNGGMLANIFNDMIMKHTPAHNYNMRQNVAYKMSHCKQNTLAYFGPKLWNTIITNNHIEDCTSMNILKGQ